MGTYLDDPASPTYVMPMFRGRTTVSTEQEFASEVEPHLATMLRLARRLGRNDAEDIVQDALARAWSQRSRFNPERGGFRSWLLAITADQAYKTWRWHRRHSKPILAQPAGHPAQDDLVDLESAIQRLPTRQRLAVNCFYFAGLSVNETAAVMKCSDGTVKSTLSAARAALRDSLR